MALIAGAQAPIGRIMGHAGAMVSPGESDAREKAKLLADAGAVITNHPSKFGDHMAKLLGAKSQVNHQVCRQSYAHLLLG